LVAAAAVVGCGGSSEESSGGAAAKPGAKKVTAISFQTDFLFGGWVAPFFLAADRGYYKDEGLDVTVREGNGSAAALKTLIGGLNQIVLADRSTMAVEASRGPDFVSVMGQINRGGLAIVSLKKAGIVEPKDLEGKTLGVTVGSNETAILPAFLKQNGIDAAKLKIENLAAPQKAQFLQAGKVDAISFVNYSAVSIAPFDELNIMNLTDFGMDIVGNGVVTTKEWAGENPDAVAGFVRASAKGFADAIKEPDAAVDALLKRATALPREVALQQLERSLEGLKSPGTEDKPIGFQAPETWDGMVESFKSLGLIENDQPATNYYTNDYVQDGG
jgi:NitT/TauT family transport system substrate-binding protein